MMKPLLCATLAFAASIASAAEIERTTVFSSDQGGYKVYRIPAAIVTPKGTLLAFCEGRQNPRGKNNDTGEINLIVKRSSDNGKTFSDQQIVWADGKNTCGNPCPVVDESTGTIHLLMTHNLGTDHEREITLGTSKGKRTAWVTLSTDDGVTWAKPREITKDVMKPDWAWYATGPGVGIQLKNGPHKGRLVVPCDHVVRGGGAGAGNSHVIYSEDHGQTWKLGGEAPKKEFNESQVVELSDGRVMLNMRNHSPALPKGSPKHRGVCVSDDGGVTFTDLRRDETLIEPICQASIQRAGGRVLFANPASQEKRVAMTVRASTDDAKTWPVSLLVHEGPSAYSCLVALPDGSIGLLYELGEKYPYERIEFARFKLEKE
jgi:sialidase-1